ncbi:hypothetical protein HJ590_13115 [Naumannella sp. ID2617S]|nr:hypothetical protein [Naumannella sp. ID2617S]
MTLQDTLAQLSTLTDEDLNTLHTRTFQELRRRQEVVNADAALSTVGDSQMTDAGMTRGGPWAQPPAGTVGYPKGWTVTDGGKMWESTMNGNVFKPGVSGWREKTVDGKAAPYRMPSGSHDAYNTGDQMLWTDGLVHEASRDGVVWGPDNDPGGWRCLAKPPTPPTPTGPAAWVQPVPGDSLKPSYMKGATVTHKAATWTSDIDGNVWEPSVYGWTKATSNTAARTTAVKA